MIGRTHGYRIIGRRKSPIDAKPLPPANGEPVVSLRCLVDAQHASTPANGVAHAHQPPPAA